MIYTLFNDYVAQPIINAVTPYIQSMMNFAYNQGVAAATKGVSGAVTSKAADFALHVPAPAVVPVLDNRSYKDKAKSFTKGLVSENVTQAGLNALKSVVPVPAPVLYMAPRATNLTLTRMDNSNTAAKNIAFGAMSHGFGTVMQEQVDALLPQAAPYGGYIAYGISSAAARAGLEHVARKITM